MLKALGGVDHSLSYRDGALGELGLFLPAEFLGGGEIFELMRYRFRDRASFSRTENRQLGILNPFFFFPERDTEARI